MSFRQWRGLWAVLLAAGLCGCPRPAETDSSEQNDPHYRAGKEKLSALDYKGALASFERALESNPRSALVHFELALLYEQQEHDYASALYHYRRAVKLRPSGYPADNARQRIPGCERELVKLDYHSTINPAAMREVERLRDENTGLRRQLESVQAQLAAARSNAALRPSPPLASGSRTADPAPLSNPGPTPGAGAGAGSSPGYTRVPPAGPTSPGSRPPATPGRTRAHAVKQGETPMAIARLYQVRLDALLAANPGLDARKMRVGQTVNVPAP